MAFLAKRIHEARQRILICRSRSAACVAEHAPLVSRRALRALLLAPRRKLRRAHPAADPDIFQSNCVECRECADLVQWVLAEEEQREICS